ncbi:MAG: glycoside hydrolase family 3 C-terminal domain-containing protein [Alistipes sp.]|nr:glycoside hydrolase family 3 C-terminal domain-containing protein [Alistipes sp.]
MKRFFLTLSAVLLGLTVSAQMLPYQNPALSNEERARDLVSRMTLEEKVSQMQNGAAPIDRLGIPFYDWWSEALHGIARAGLATVFPQTIGMASSFDEQLIEQVFTATSDEARAKYIKFIKEGSRKRYQGLSVWTPNINIFRDPRWGRGQETYGEDPYLTTQLGLAVVRGLQGDPNAKFNKLHACAKHYAVHSGPEWNRHSFDAKNISKRDLRETYLPAFEALVREGNVKEVMGAYNRFEGDPCNASNYLLEEILRKEWGYKGIVVSDCGAIRDFYMKGHHETHADAAEASAAAVKAGCDLECGSSYAALVEAVKRGLITEKEIDRAVERLMVAKFEMGLFEKVDPYSHIPYSVVDCAEHRALAKEMAIKSFVLLQNRDDLLPLDKAKKVAIVGPNADNEEMQWANYNGIPSYTITLKEGLEALLPKTQVIYEQLCGHTDVGTYQTLFNECSYGGKPGFKATYWNNLDFEGAPAATNQVTRPMSFDTGGNTVFAPGVNLSAFTARYEATFKPENTGRAVFRISSNETVRIYVDGKLLADKTNVKNTATVCEFEYELGATYDIKIEFGGYRRRTDAYLNLDMAEAVPQDIPAFLKRVKDVDVVIFAGGISPRLEGEEMAVTAPGFRGGDRDDIELPAIQRETIAALKEAGKKVVLVNFSGSALALEPETENCDAILQAWYPGQEGGSALAEVLYGDAAPSGKLPITFYRNVKQLPDFEDYNMEGKTYRYFEGDPLFRFGYGLTYTEFYHGKPRADRSTLKIEGNKPIYITAPVGNIGTRPGTEIVQLYIQRPSDKEGPIQTLRAYRRVELQPGESKMVVFALDAKDFAWFNPATERMEPLKGQYVVRIGSSSDVESHRTVRVTLK